MTFLAFLGQKITKIAKKSFFILKSGNFFWHTLIIWEDQHFSCFTLFDFVKKVRKNEIFLAFLGQKITKMAKKPFFILKSGNFFWHTLIIWGDNFFSVFTFLIWSKKVAENGKNTLLMAHAQKWLFSIFAHFFWPNQKCKNWKILVSPND